MLLRDWIARKPAAGPQRTVKGTNGRATGIDTKLWPGSWAAKRRGASLIRRDLRAAGIAYRDDAGRVFDFHALRGQFVTDLGRGGVSLQEAQKLARHCDPRLTSNLYTHLSVVDVASALERLPQLPTDTEPDALGATGTNGGMLAHQLAPIFGVSCPDLASDGNNGAMEPGEGDTSTPAPQLPQAEGFGNDCHCSGTVVTNGRGGIRTRTPVTGHGILSPERLPIPPLGQEVSHRLPKRPRQQDFRKGAVRSARR